MADSQITPSYEIVTRKDAKASGAKRYYTGKPCSKGHVDYRYVCDHSCAECVRIKVASQRVRNPEMRKRDVAARKARYRSDPDYRAKKIAETAEWVSRNQERSREYHKQRYASQKEKLGAQNKELRNRKKLDPEWIEKERARNRERHKRNPEAKRCHVRKRRAMLRNAEGTHNHKDIAALLEKQGHKCVYCDADLKNGYDVDHIMPLSKGGSNWPDNLQCLCPPCNGKKWCKDPDDFAKEIGRL